MALFLSFVALGQPVLAQSVAPEVECCSVAPTSAVDDLLGAACRTNSFVPDTEVLMADGTTKPISDVKIGDWVWAHDPETGETGARQVVDTIVGDGEKHLVDIEALGDTVTATAGHPFWVEDEGRWVDAGDLEAGDRLLLADGSTAPVTAIDEWAGVQRVHNLTVEGIHTYYVEADDEQVLVHNCRVDQLGGLAADFDADELAQLTYQHIGAGDIAGRPSLSQIGDALATEGVQLPDQNAVRFLVDDVVVIINEDVPWRSTSYFQGG